MNSNKYSYILGFFLPVMGGPRDNTAKKNKSNKGKHLDDLKRELEFDLHKIPIADLYKRYNCIPTNVCILISIVFTYISDVSFF